MSASRDHDLAVQCQAETDRPSHATAMLAELAQCALELEEAAHVFDGVGFPGLASVYRKAAARARAVVDAALFSSAEQSSGRSPGTTPSLPKGQDQ